MKIPVLKIRDENGNIIPINAIRGEKGQDGVNGKSAYEQAQEGGYKGTEQEFIALINGLTAGEHAEHYANLDNPHQVTAQQAGALPITGGQLQGGLGLKGEGDANTSEIVQNSDFATIIRNKAGGIETILSLTNESKVDVADVLKLWFANGNGYSIYGEHNKPTASEVGAIPEGYYASDDLNTELQQGGSKMKVCSYHSGTLNTPFAEGLTVFAHGMVITNAYDLNYGTQLCMPSGEDAIYVRRLNGSGISKWVKMTGVPQLTIGSYVGTGTYGEDNPNSLTFEFEPKFLVITGGTSGFAVRGGGINVFHYGTVNQGCVRSVVTTTWDNNTVTWYNYDEYNGATNQMNYQNATYHYIAIG